MKRMTSDKIISKHKKCSCININQNRYIFLTLKPDFSSLICNFLPYAITSTHIKVAKIQTSVGISDTE